jgi:hypothetical protein
MTIDKVQWYEFTRSKNTKLVKNDNSKCWEVVNDDSTMSCSHGTSDVPAEHQMCQQHTSSCSHGTSDVPAEHLRCSHGTDKLTIYIPEEN